MYVCFPKYASNSLTATMLVGYLNCYQYDTNIGVMLLYIMLYIVLAYLMLYIVLAYLMLYIVLAYLMLFAALSNAVCLYNASFLPMISAIAFYFHVLSWFIET